jgi:hypothetical protein
MVDGKCWHWRCGRRGGRRWPWVDQATLARPRRCGAKTRLEWQSEMGEEASARAAKAKGGLASSFSHDHKGIRRFEAARGGQEGQVAWGGAAAGAVETDGGAVGFVATRVARARRKWLMGRLSGWAWVGTVELGSAQDRTKISLFSIFPLVQA